MNDRNVWISQLVNQLTKLAKPDDPDREVLAHLRRGLCGPAAYTLSRVGWLFRSVPDDWGNRALDNAILAAGLFAWVKGKCTQADNVNFGRAFGSVPTDDQKQRREKRFTALLDADPTELPFLLRQAVTLIEGQPLDWKSLIVHLMNWDDPDRYVQKQWARGFWWNPKPDAETAAETTDAN